MKVLIAGCAGFSGYPMKMFSSTGDGGFVATSYQSRRYLKAVLYNSALPLA